MVNCPQCTVKSRSRAGLSMHFRGTHPDKWKGTLKASAPAGFNFGMDEPSASNATRRNFGLTTKVRKKKNKKKNTVILRGNINYCPACGYHIRPHELAVGFTESNHES